MPLQWSDLIYKASLDHAKDHVKGGFTGHTGSDGSSVAERINRYGIPFYGHIAENCNYAVDNAFDAILSLIVDDGVSSRGHRKNVYNMSSL